MKKVCRSGRMAAALFNKATGAPICYASGRSLLARWTLDEVVTCISLEEKGFFFCAPVLWPLGADAQRRRGARAFSMRGLVSLLSGYLPRSFSGSSAAIIDAPPAPCG